MSEKPQATTERPPRSKTTPRAIARLERETNVMKMRTAGFTFEQIGSRVGITKQAAYLIVVKVLARQRAKLGVAAQDLIDLEVMRLDAILSAIFKDALAGDLFAVDRVLKISERRSKLLGLDAPQAMVLGQFDPEVAENITKDFGLDDRLAIQEAFVKGNPDDLPRC